MLKKILVILTCLPASSFVTSSNAANTETTSFSIARCRSLYLIVIYLGVFCGGRQASAADAKSIFKSIGPGVVTIRDSERYSSGVVVSPKGLIITCYSAVCTPLKQTITAEVLQAGKLTKKDFSDIKLVSVHPQYDLALIQVTASPDTKFVVPPRSARRTLNTGEDCYVIGGPSGALSIRVRPRL